jgi:hypothetical protein
MALHKYKEFVALMEGGFASTKTQETPITPQVIGQIQKFIQKLSSDFNSHLRELDVPSLDFLKPVGSGSWWEDDLKEHPDKLYGDVDYLVAYPTLKLTSGKDREDEIATEKMYNQELLMWLEADKYKGIDVEETKMMSSPTSVKLLVEIELEDKKTGYVQVDMVVTHKEYQNWSIFRYTPMRGVKGFVIGNLYSSFGEVLDIQIQTRGVRAKMIAGKLAAINKRKDVEEKFISTNIQTFMQDIANFVWEISGSDKPLDKTAIASWKGMDRNNPRIEDLCDGIVLLSKTLEQLGEFGGTVKYKSGKEFLEAVANRYDKKMTDASKAAKLDKAYSPMAIAAVEKIRTLVNEYVPLVHKLLK